MDPKPLDIASPQSRKVGFEALRFREIDGISTGSRSLDFVGSVGLHDINGIVKKPYISDSCL